MRIIGISSENAEWTNHSHFMISRTKLTFNLKILTFPNPDLSDFIKIGKSYLQFKLEGTNKIGSLFLNPLIQNMIVEWYKI
jgi:hypothetical protein